MAFSGTATTLKEIAGRIESFIETRSQNSTGPAAHAYLVLEKT